MMKYLGGGYLPDVPARDLSAEEAEIYGREMLLASGLYQAVEGDNDDIRTVQAG